MIAAIRRFVLRLLNAGRPHAGEIDLERELRSHLTLLEDEHLRRGVSSTEARFAAQRAMGSVALAKDLHRDARSFVWIDDARRDLFAAIAITLAAVGIYGVMVIATSAIFAAVALAASYVPARRATAVDPSVALRAE